MKDYRVCDWCRANEGEICRTDAEMKRDWKGWYDFPEGERPARAPGIPAHFQCRCRWEEIGAAPVSNFYFSYPKAFLYIRLMGISGWILLGTTRKTDIEFMKYEELEPEGFGLKLRLKDGREFVSKSGELALSLRSNDLETKKTQLSANLWAEFRTINHSLDGKTESVVHSFRCRFIDWMGSRTPPSRPQNRYDLEGNTNLNVGFSRAGILEMRCQLFEQRINEINSYPISNAINIFKTPSTYLEKEEELEELEIIPLIISSIPNFINLFAPGSNIWKNLITDVAAAEMPENIPAEYPEGYKVLHERMYRLTGEWKSPGVFRLQWKNVFPVIGYYVYRKKRQPPEKSHQLAWECINPIKTPEWYWESPLRLIDFPDGAVWDRYNCQVVAPLFSLGTDVHLDVTPTFTGDIFYVRALGPISAPESTEWMDIIEYLAVPFREHMHITSPPGARESDMIIAGKMKPPEYGSP